MASLKGFHIDDPLADADDGAIEITLTMDDGSQRWCYFMTPSALTATGDCVPGTEVTFHYNAPYMIVVSEISADIIDRVLRCLDQSGDLLSCSLHYGERVDRPR